MIKGLAITPPILGRISIGKVVEKNGKRLPEKDDQFTITSQVQNRDGWVNCPNYNGSSGRNRQQCLNGFRKDQPSQRCFAPE